MSMPLNLPGFVQLRQCRAISVAVGALALGLMLVAQILGSAAAASADRELKIVAFGDSLTAGYGLARGDAFPVKLEAALRARGHNIRILNSGVSGDTLKGGLARLDWAVPKTADAVIVELGANDALRGIAPAESRQALEEILKRLKRSGKPVLVAGMEAPNNYGADYAKAFRSMFPKLADKYGALLYPFFLEGVALKSELNQGDGIHPNAAGVDVIVRRILPSVEALIKQVHAK